MGKSGLRRLALGGLAVAPGLALAEVPAAFTTAVTNATTDGTAMMTAVLGVAAAFVVLGIALKMVKRLRGAS